MSTETALALRDHQVAHRTALFHDSGVEISRGHLLFDQIAGYRIKHEPILVPGECSMKFDLTISDIIPELVFVRQPFPGLYPKEENVSSDAGLCSSLPETP